MKAKPINHHPGYVTIARGMRVPESFTLRLPPPSSGGLSIEMDFAASDERVACTRLEVRGNIDEPVSAALLRLIRFDELTRLATSQNAILDSTVADLTGLNVGEISGVWDRNVSTAVRRRDTSQNLGEVAQIWQMAGGGDAAVKELMSVYTISESRAWRLIRQARDAGHIPEEPLRRGRHMKAGDNR